MASTCPRCGATRSDPVPHGTAYKLARLFGYRLQRCAQCRLPRFIPRHPKKTDAPPKTEAEAAAAESTERGAALTEEAPAQTARQAAGDVRSEPRPGRCPVCGGNHYHRSRRSRAERLLLRPRMARCENCGARFAYPTAHDQPAESPTPEREVAEPREPAEEENPPDEAAPASTPNSGFRGCPVCGSMEFRRSHRTTLERILLRPKMARCKKCRHRFPFPRRSNRV
jgi:hypothetical protein